MKQPELGRGKREGCLHLRFVCNRTLFQSSSRISKLGDPRNHKKHLAAQSADFKRARRSRKGMRCSDKELTNWEWERTRLRCSPFKETCGYPANQLQRRQSTSSTCKGLGVSQGRGGGTGKHEIRRPAQHGKTCGTFHSCTIWWPSWN